MTTTSDADRLIEAYRDRGLSPEAARLAARGRSGAGSGAAPASGFDALVESFRARGLSPEAARQAAIGRDYCNESEVRAAETRLTESRGRSAPEVQLPEVRSPGQAAMLVAEVATRRLGMDETAARQYSVRLMERELNLGGYGHALNWLQRLAAAMNTQEAV